MSTQGSYRGIPGSSSPFTARSAPWWQEESGSIQTQTPGTTPVDGSDFRSGSQHDNTGGPEGLEQYPRRSGLWQAHLERERERLARVARLGLDKSPSKSLKQGRSMASELPIESASATNTSHRPADQPTLGMKEPRHPWAVPAGRWPSALHSPNERAQIASSASYLPAQISKLSDPLCAALWTPPTLNQVFPFSEPPLHRFSSKKPQPSASAWTFPHRNFQQSAIWADNPSTNPELSVTQGLEELDVLRMASSQTADVEGTTMKGQPQRDRQQGPPISSPWGPAPTSVPAVQVWQPWTAEKSISDGQQSDLASKSRTGSRLLTLIPRAQVPSVAQPPAATTPYGFPVLADMGHHRGSVSARTASTSVGTTTTGPTSAPLGVNAPFYHPMNCRNFDGQDRALTRNETHALLLKGFSPNYRGDPDLPRNQSAAIPAEQNCSLFLVGLAPDLTTHELLSGIRGIGRVYATHINPPAPERGHVFSAAKLVFFERQAAELFYSLFAPTGYATPRNPQMRARVSWNRVRSAEVDVGGRRSRVLLISGPPAIVNQRFLCGYLDTKLVYQLDEVVHHGASPDGSRVLLEFRFGSFRCQAEAARMALMREFREAGVVCDYGWDPCDHLEEQI